MLKSSERCGLTSSLEPTTPVANRMAASQDGVAVQLDRYVRIGNYVEVFPAAV
jgi:hypothetical protein